jgi:murein DD-endopeptidase MepM/ murein hydrolase activator NlpD
VKRALAAAALALVVVAIQVTAAGATSPSPCPSPSAASSARVSCSATTADPNQAAYDQLRARLGGDLANALTTQQNLMATLNQTSASVQILTDQVTREETVISNLEDQIAQLDSQIADTQARIDVEKEQVAAMAKAIYRQPDSLWMLIARTGNVSQALQATLEADLAKLQADRAARQADLDRENATLDRLNTTLGTLSDMLSTQTDLSSQVADIITQIQDADNSLQDQPPDVTAALADLLESQEQDLLQQSNQAAWDAAHVGVGEALIAHILPSGTTISGLILSWPMAGGRVTQPFGPSDLLLEPPLGKYAHFHTGIDIAAAFGTTVTAAAPGVVVAVGHTNIGYGNYVVIGHGGGIMTLYGHLLETDVTVGATVARGQRIGLEGSTGWSTGPHVHFELRVNDSVVDPMPYLLKPAN